MSYGDQHVNASIHLISLAAKTVASKSATLSRISDDAFEEMESEAAKALTECGKRWEAYCEENSYDPSRLDYFQAFAMRRMKGSIIDMWRRESPLVRSDIDFYSYLNKNGEDATAEKYGMTLAEVAQKTLVITQTLNHRDYSTVENDNKTATSSASDSTWAAIYVESSQLPLVCKVWMTMVYVMGVSPNDAANLLDVDKNEVSRYTDYRLLDAVLTEKGVLN